MAQTGDQFGSDAFQRFLRQPGVPRYRLDDFLSRLAELPQDGQVRAVYWVRLSLRAMGGTHPAGSQDAVATREAGDSPIDDLGRRCRQLLTGARLDEDFFVRSLLTTASQWIYLRAETTPRWAEHKHHLLAIWEADLSNMATDLDYVPQDPTSRNLGLSREAQMAHLQKMISIERMALAGVDDIVGGAVGDAELWDRLVLVPLMASPSP